MTAWPLIFAGEASTHEPELDFVADLLTVNSLAVMFGASGTGKSFVAIDLAMRVACGMPWHGRSTDQSGVLYVAMEGGGAFSCRVDAWLQHHGRRGEDIPFAYAQPSLDLSRVDDVNACVAAAHDLRERSGLPVRLVVIDTLSRALAGADENDSKAMGGAVAALDRIREGSGACVLSVHHSGKDPSRGARGHSLLRCALDTEIEVTRVQDSPIGSIRIAKSRDFSDGDKYRFELASVRVGLNRRGEPIGSRVAIASDAPEPAARGPKFSGGTEIARQALVNVLATHGTRVTRSDVPASVVCASFEQWRSEAYAMGIAAGEATQDARRKAFGRAVKTLAGAHVVAMRDDLVWLAS